MKILGMGVHFHMRGRDCDLRRYFLSGIFFALNHFADFWTALNSNVRAAFVLGAQNNLSVRVIQKSLGNQGMRSSIGATNHITGGCFGSRHRVRKSQFFA